MTALTQVFWGVTLAAAACIFHVGMLAASVPGLTRFAASLGLHREWMRNGAMLAFVLGVVILWVGALPDLNSAIYFGIVTYTTLGYGDIVLGEGLRIFLAMASFTGLLTFGVSTAFFLGVITRFLPSLFGK